MMQREWRARENHTVRVGCERGKAGESVRPEPRRGLRNPKTTPEWSHHMKIQKLIRAKAQNNTTQKKKQPKEARVIVGKSEERYARVRLLT